MKIPELAQKWIEFLKTGPLKAKGALDRGGGRRCCLGHLCYLDKDLEKTKIENRYLYEGSGIQLPDKILNKVKLTRLGLLNFSGKVMALRYIKEQGVKSSRYLFDSLSDINDETNITHAQMGKLIEKLYEGDGFVHPRDVEPEDL